MTSMRAAVLALAFASSVGCSQAHDPASGSCGGLCEPCCAGDVCEGGSCRGGVCLGGVSCLDAGSVADAGRDAGPPPGCGHLCQPCCPGDVCFGGVCSGGGSGGTCRGGILCDAGVDAAMPEDAGRSDAGSACAQIDALDRHCATDADCASAIHAADCCGTYAAIGFAASETDAYAALEPLCAASYPACGCAAGPTMTDSGEIVNDPSSVQVACVTRGPGAVCLTYVTMRPPNGR